MRVLSLGARARSLARGAGAGTAPAHAAQFFFLFASLSDLGGVFDVYRAAQQKITCPQGNGLPELPRFLGRNDLAKSGLFEGLKNGAERGSSLSALLESGDTMSDRARS
jgi:hypothetical protein